MAEEINVNRDWSFEINLSGVEAAGGYHGKPLVEGYYKFMMTDLYTNPAAKNPDRVVVRMEVAEGSFKGAWGVTGFNPPKPGDDKSRPFIRLMAESVGYAPSDLDKGTIRLGMDSFKGRVGHIYFVPKSESEGRKWDEYYFRKPVQWAQQKQEFEMRAAPVAEALGSTGSALGTTEAVISAASSTLGTNSAPGNAMNKTDLLAGLLGQA